MVENQLSIQADEARGIDVIAMLQVILKRKLLIILITVATALLSIGYTLTLPNIYAATAKVLPPQKEGGGLSSVLGQMGGIAGIAAGAAKGSESDLYLSLVKSRTVGAAVIGRLELAKVWHTANFNQTWRTLDAAVKVQAGRDGIIAITAEDKDPRRAALLANTMVDELGRIMVTLNLSKVGSERLFLEKRLEVVKKDLKAAEEELKAFSQQNGIAHVDSQATATVSGVVRLKNEVASKEVQLAALRSYQSDDNFEVKELQAAITRLKQELAKESGRHGGEGIPSLGKVPALGLEYARRLRAVKTQEALFEQLTKQYEMAKINEAKDSSSLQVLDEAVPPEEKVRPHRFSLVALASTIALVSSVLLAFLLEHAEKLSEEERKVFRQLARQALSFR